MNQPSSLRRVVVESPCSGDMAANADYLTQALRDSLRRGEAPIASHGLLAFSQVLDEHNALQRMLGCRAGWAWITSADAVVVYEDHGISRGMREAIDIATAHSIPVEYRRLLLSEARPAIAADNVPEVDG